MRSVTTLRAARLHGRADETTRLDDALARATPGRLSAIFVEGEAGAGKTRLLEQAVEHARRRGFRVFAARAEELESSRPFGVIADALGCERSSTDPRRAAIARSIAPDLDRGDDAPSISSDPGLQYRVVGALVELIEAAAMDGPVTLVLDDLQWADPSSLLTIRSVCRRLAYLPVALVASLRPMPRSPELTRLLDACRVEGGSHLVLEPLTEDDVFALAADCLGAAPGPRLQRLLRGAAGNPLFVVELLQAIEGEGGITFVEGQAEVTRARLPTTLRLALLHRIAFLPPPVLEIMRHASILGSSFTPLDLATVTGRPVVALSGMLGEAIAANLLEDAGDRLRFRHDLIRDAIYEDIPEAVRMGLHSEAGRRLAAAGAPALQVAEHIVRGAKPGDDEALRWLAAAARDAAPCCPEVASHLLGKAVALAGPAHPDRDRLLADRAVSLMWSGRIPEAEAICRELLGRDHDPGVEGMLRTSLTRTLLAQGRVRHALEEAEAALGSPHLTDGERVAAKAWGGLARLWLWDFDGALAFADDVAAATRDGDDPLSACVGMAVRATLLSFRGRPEEALSVIDEAVRVADASPDRVGHRFQLHAARGHVLAELDRLDEAIAALEAGRKLSEELGTRWNLPTYEVFMTAARYLAGQWDDAAAQFEASLELAADTGESHSLILARSIMAMIALHRNDLEEAAHHAALAERDLVETGPRYRAHWAWWAKSLVQEAEGDLEGARDTLGRLWNACTDAGFVSELPLIGPDLVRIATALDDRDLATAVAAAVEQVPEVGTRTWVTGAALRCRGVAGSEVRPLLEAVDVCARSARPLDEALAREAAGTLLAKQGRLDDARRLFEGALRIYEDLDAERDAARAESILRAHGLRRGRRGARKRPAVGWQSLTPTERRVVELVAQGLSNPQIGERLFISPRTVQTHLAHVFAKLNVSGRAQLAAEASRRSLARPSPR